ncbi:hypothetical protein WS68_24025 [Burkholderia sp. TSV86]|nr:hypothetical protein WS68_24025 [Burkholderia sp. TSV86]
MLIISLFIGTCKQIDESLILRRGFFARIFSQHVKWRRRRFGLIGFQVGRGRMGMGAFPFETLSRDVLLQTLHHAIFQFPKKTAWCVPVPDG